MMIITDREWVDEIFNEMWNDGWFDDICEIIADRLIVQELESRI